MNNALMMFISEVKEEMRKTKERAENAADPMQSLAAGAQIATLQRILEKADYYVGGKEG